MADVEIRRLAGDEMIEETYFLLTYAFEPSPPLYDKDEWRQMLEHFTESIVYAAYEDGQAVASAAGAPMTINVRDSMYPMMGIWGVATHPAARRKGYASNVLRAVLETAHEDGVPLTCLYAFRESFYERQGYVMWPQPRRATFKTAALAPVLTMDIDGHVEMMAIKDGFELYRDYLRRRQQETHGMALGTDHSAEEMRRRNASWLAVARDGHGEVIGLMTYSVNPPDGKMTVSRFYPGSVQARYLLLDWMARHIDQADEIELSLPPDAHPELWLSDLRVKLAALEPPLGRVLTVAGLDGIPVGQGTFSAQVRDRFCPWNEGVWRFEADDGVLRTRPAERADCELSIHALSALVYGVRDPAEFAVRGWGSPPGDVQAAMRAMFPQRVPWHHSEY